ncbi:hypothetical protein FW107_07520 [Campylobacter jejuni]|nr:hypothetical protein [Campylobacter jejuni]
MILDNEAKKILIERELAKRSVYELLKYKFKYYYNQSFNDNWHYGYISEILEGMILGQVKRVAISEPPSYGKSEQCVKTFIPYAWLKNPSYKFIYTTYGDALTQENASATRDFIKSKAYQYLGVDFKITLDNVGNFKNDKDGRVFSTTVGSAVTGVHCNGLIIDDPFKAIEAGSAVIRNKVYDYYTGSLLSRLLDEKSFILIIMQRLHPDDLIGRLLTNDSDWFYVNLQAINIEKTYYNFGKFSYEREANEALFSKKHSLENLEKLKISMGIVDFNAQYQQNPEVSEAGEFLKENLSFINDFDLPEQNLYILIDPAESTKKTADDRAITCNGLSIEENGLELLITYDCFYAKWDLENFISNTLEMMMKYPGAPVLIEQAGGGITFSSELEKAIIRINTKFKNENKATINNTIIRFTPNRRISKNEKIMALKPYYNTGCYKIRANANGKEQIIKEFLAFNPLKTSNTDNCIDTIANMFALSSFIKPKDNTKKQIIIQRHKQVRKTWRI